MRTKYENYKTISEIVKNWVTVISLIIGLIYTFTKISDLLIAKEEISKQTAKKEKINTNIQEIRLQKEKSELCVFLRFGTFWNCGI